MAVTTQVAHLIQLYWLRNASTLTAQGLFTNLFGINKHIYGSPQGGRYLQTVHDTLSDSSSMKSLLDISDDAMTTSWESQGQYA